MENKKKKSIYPFFKRLADFLLSFIAIIVFSPVFIIVYILSFFILKGNPIFKQYRPGKNNKIFAMYKFRSMTNKKDANGNLLPDKDRITTWGKILRKTSIDELPQLFNILKGDMSIIGPRPRLVKDTIFYDETVLKAYNVKPGLTGPAQVYDPSSTQSWENVFKRDLDYAENVTFKNDCKLFFGTFAALFKDRSAGGANQSQQKREYYYSDHLLKNNMINEKQYNLGLQQAKQLKPHDVITYNPELRENLKEDSENGK